MRVSNATENQSLPRTSEPQPAVNTSTNILPTNSENVNNPSFGENVNRDGMTSEEYFDTFLAGEKSEPQTEIPMLKEPE